MSDAMERLKSALADRYAIEHELGVGGMATVYLAEDLRHKRKVAVKVLRPELAAVLGADRFVQEITTTANLQHPHILPLFDSGEADSFLYYVMPFIDGETLRDKLNRETQLGIDEAVRITTAVADALDYAHRHNVIHRDIKPENILLHDGRPMVADFGIALAVSAAAGGRMTETGLSLGTPHYMSPEQATAEKDLTNRSDVYSLGCVLYEMLTGDPPHTGSSAQAIIMKIVTDEARPVTELRKSVPPHVAAATAKSLEKLAADRFESAAKFGEALVTPTFALPTTPTAGGIAAPSRPTIDRTKIVLLVVATVLTATTAWGWLRSIPKPVSRYSLAMPRDQALASNVWSRIGISADGERMVYIGTTEQGPRLFVRARDQLRATQLPGTEDAVNPFFSPDGRRVGFFTTISPREIKVVSIVGGPPTTIVDSAVGLPGATWGYDGYIYFDAAGIGPLLRVSESGGGIPEAVATLDTASGEQQHNWPDALPNGRGVIFKINRMGGMSEHDIAVLDLATGEHRVLVRGVYARYAASGHLVYVTADGTLMVVPFDQDELAVTGEPTAVVDGLSIRSGESVDLAVSATGTLLYTTGALTPDPHEVVWVARDGTGEVIDPTWVAAFSSVALSPDETQLAVTVITPNEWQVWVKTLPRGPFTLLSLEGSSNSGPRWTPDGRAVTFVSNRAGGFGAQSVYVRRADGSAPAEPLVNHDRLVFDGSITEDGAWFVARVGFGGDIVGYQISGDSAPVLLVATNATEATPAVSPDGRWLAYVSDESGNNEVYVRPFPNTGDGRTQVSTAGGEAPRWARDGRHLFYRSTSRNELVAVEVIPGPGPTLAVSEPEVLFSLDAYVIDDYDATEDGRFVMIRRRGAERPSELIVVENWFEELKAMGGNE
ncbi:MAG: protein kinase [Gemmatimonadetes bacterium]|nr:protein kinase [Gemmatimonadota bacterium]